MGWMRLKLLLFEIRLLAYMEFSSLVRFKLWWYRRSGREGKAQQLVNYMVGDFCRSVLRKLGCVVLLEGGENIPPEQAFVLMVNHQSKYDIALLGGYFGTPMGFVAKKELFRIPGFSYWMRQIDCLPLDRKDISGGVAAMARLGAKMKEKHHGFIVFPEGTRSRDPDGTIQSFRRGSLRLAAEHDLPVLPVSIDGTRLLDRADCLTKTRRGGRIIRVKIAAPRKLAANTAPERRKFMEDLKDLIVSNRDAIRVTWPEC